MDDIHKFVAEWNAKSSEGAFERYLKVRDQEVAEKAKKTGILETAKNMLALNINIEDIKKVTGLTEKQIKKLQS